ncbi:hypothetical protein BDZ45DRAFT_754258 [Acephala macrosclerotiorum]|nr:hypothetical protein BDZ45DRAFT_754258 [Acephala macrosclerotiorum]
MVSRPSPDAVGARNTAPERPRRSFKKSRRGCKTCKARKVKCDEQRPICANCCRRHPGLTSCDFEQFIEVSSQAIECSTSQKRVKATPQRSIQPSLTLHPSGLSSSDGSRVLELRLMWHYTSSTCTQLPSRQTSQGNYVWSTDIPRLAFHSELVLSALLGISALHHWALTPEDPTLSYAAGYYFDKAVRNHRIALSNVDKYSAEAVLATAIIICHHTWLSAHRAKSTEAYEIPLQTYHMARGIQVLFDQMYPWLRGSPYLWYIESQPVLEATESSCQEPWMTTAREDLARLSDTFEYKDVSASDKIVYEKMVMELTSMCHSISTGVAMHNIQRRVATMPLRLPPRFLELVEAKDPRALGLLARNLSLLKVIDSIWWLHGLEPSQPVAEQAIVGILAMLPHEWLWIMEWPLEIISGEVRS